MPSGEGAEGEGRLGKQSKMKRQTIPQHRQTPWQRLPEAPTWWAKSLLSFLVMHLLVFVVCVTKEQNEHQQMRGRNTDMVGSLESSSPF